MFDILSLVSYVPVNKNGHGFITGRHITLIQSFFKLYSICSEINNSCVGYSNGIYPMNSNCHIKNSAAAQVRINRARVEALAVSVTVKILGIHNNVVLHASGSWLLTKGWAWVQAWEGALDFKRHFSGSNLCVGARWRLKLRFLCQPALLPMM